VRIGDWDAFTCPLELRDIVQIGDTTYCATGGGLMLYNNGDFEVYTTVDGLHRVDLFSISKDKYRNVWLGGKSPNGFVQIYNIERNNINIFDYGLTEITEFWVGDSIAFAAFIDGQDLGLIKWVYYDNRWSYRDIYRNFPFVMESINGLEIINNTVFLATDNGLLKADILGNLKDPNSWTLVSNDFNDPIDAMCQTNNGFAFTLNENIYKVFYNNGAIQYEQLDIQMPVNFTDMLFDEEEFIWGIHNRNVYSQKNDFVPITTGKTFYTISSDNQGNIIIGSELGLIVIDKITHEKNVYTPNSPATGKFSALKVLSDGRLVGASSKGLSIKDFDGWRNVLEIKYENTEVVKSNYNYNTFIADTIKYDFGDAVTDLEEGPDGLVYCAIEGTFPVLNNPERIGGGIIIIDIDNPENVTVIDTSILGYYSSGTSNNAYMVVKDIEFDNDGNLWVANTYVTNKNLPVHVRNLNNEWRSYGSSETSVKISQSPISIEFDRWSRVWMSAFKAEEANMGIYPDGGIFLLEYDGGAVQPTSFTWESIIYNTTVWSLGMGNNDRLYYLTPTGLNYYDISASSSPVIRENLYSYFPNISFGGGSEIKIDPLGNIWTISPTQGVHVLLENTTYWPDINGLRADNSPLLSDEVYDLDFDYDRKLAYIATSKGVSIVRIPFGDSYNDYNNLKIFPSPFFIPSNQQMTVDGLMYNSSMKIMTLDGLVIRDINSNGISVDGDQLTWDGKNNSGQYVSSGVYLLSITNNSGNNTFSKITVIKK
ncbi:uncharacterized protein METZ01_LOCUS47964, partial [marine metagenome]